MRLRSIIRLTTSLVVLAAVRPDVLHAQTGPSFDCARATHEIEKLICQDESLAALDRKLADVYAGALGQPLSSEQVSHLRAEQRGWTSGRDECWKADDARDCTAREYTDRIVTLQARYGLVMIGNTVYWTCGGQDVAITPVSTDPPTINMVRGDEALTAIRRASASGSKYEAPFGVFFWERGGEATLAWPQDTEVSCTRKA